MDKLIICVAPTGGFQGREANPALPYTPEEIAEDVYRCWNEGAAMVHIHARDKDGWPTNDPEVFREVDRQIRKRKCNIIIQHSTAMARRREAIQRGEAADPEEGVRSLEANPEMGSLSMGPVASVLGGLTNRPPVPWIRSFIEKTAKLMLDKGIKPEMEVFNPAMMEDVYNLINKGLVKKPYWITFIMVMHRVMQGAVAYTPKALMHYLDLLPPDSMFSVIGITEAELSATSLSILLGGHVRVGFEDNIKYRKGELAESNAQLVARTVRIAKELEREIAVPDEARKMLGVPRLQV